jgi:hypothetical protein
MSRKPNVAAIVSALEGEWRGTGRGEYPTIAPFTYRESTLFRVRDDHPSVHYEQRTWRQTPDGEVVSHWETGLMRISSDGSITVTNGQGGRAEALAGTWRPTDTGWIIELAARSFAGDPRMVAASRTIKVSARSLEYEMHMQTTATSSLLLHLFAELTPAA